ncbi:hypothetical protein GCM10009593_10810 [Microlunatus antarcticus]
MAEVIGLLFGAAPSRPAAQPPGDGGGVRTPHPPRTPEPDGEPDFADITLGEFVEDSGAKTFPQKICVTGYFLWKKQGRDTFTRDDVRNALIAAHEDMPGNFGRDWLTAASTKLIASNDNKAFSITRTGRVAVESNFQDAPKARPARRPRKTSSPPSEESA